MDSCQRGHEFTPENTYVLPDGRRRCKQCQNDRDRRRRATNAVERPPREPKPKVPCSIDGCDKVSAQRGWCPMHYQRWRKSGSTDDPAPFVRPECSVDACDRPSRKHGLCTMHDYRAKRYGDPLTVQVIREDVPRFESYTDRNGSVPSDRPDLGPCWLWRGWLIWSGYGTFTTGGVKVGAHRWAYEHYVGPIPEGLQVDHLCFVRRCVRPSHLEAVTAAENAQRRSNRFSSLSPSADIGAAH